MCPPLHSPNLPIPSKAPSTAIPPSCVPQDPVSLAAYHHAATNIHPTILAHSLRVYLHAHHISSKESLPWHSSSLLPLLFTACVFHDIGTSQKYNTSPTARFEIEGADAAATFLQTNSPSTPKDLLHEVWVAIAIHDTPQIAERIAALARLVRLGVAIDFNRSQALAMVSRDWIQEVEGKFPRGEIEKVLGDAVVEQAMECPEKAPPACWPGALYRSKLEYPEWGGINKAF